MDDKELLVTEKLEFTIEDVHKDNTEGCINCEFVEYRDGLKNYCSEHEKYINDCDSPCKAYVEQGSY